MRHLVSAVIALSIAGCASARDTQPESLNKQGSADTAGGPGRYLVIFTSDTLPGDASARVAKAGGSLFRALPEIGVASVVAGPNFAADMAKDSSVLAVGPERLNGTPSVRVTEVSDTEVGSIDGAPTPADNLYFYQWDMRRVNAPSAWSHLPAGATVAVLDVGVMDNHPDLVGQISATKSTAYCSTFGGPNETPSYPIYSTLIDFDAHPSWTPEDGCTPAPTTFEAHGTHVAGTVAAKFGGGRVVGVDPSAKVAAYKVFDRYRFTDASGVHDAVGAFDAPLFSAIIDATNSGYKVLSMSLGSVIDRHNHDDNASWLAWNRVAKYANRGGTLIIAAAGNAALDLNGTTAHIPADIPTMMSVSASGWSGLTLDPSLGFVPAPGSHDVLAFYSDFGGTVDLTAPGGDCGPTYPNGCESQYLILNDYVFPDGRAGYAFFAGTSMATPHVSAVAAMVRAKHPEFNPGDARSFLKSIAQPVGDRQSFGHGMIDADAALR